MNELATAVRWDWFKLSRRWIPWILLIILLLLSQLAVWGSYFRYTNLQQTGGTVVVGAEGAAGGRTEVSCSDVLAGKTGQLPPGTSPQVIQGLQIQCRQEAGQNLQALQQRYADFTLPGSIPNALGLAFSVGLILLAIMTASEFGAEYGWGTVRPNLIRALGRWQYVAAKLILLALLTAVALLLVIGVTAISSVAAKSLATAPVPAGSAPSWGHAAAMFGRSWVGLLPYLVFTAFVTLLARSSAGGMAIGIIYYLGEQIIVAIFSGLFGWFSSVARYLLGQNIAAWAQLSFFGQNQTSVSSLHAFVVILVYALVLGALAFIIFQRRDVTGAAAG
jgi:ABC-type transport system involved in multi-copper enzyme maturation permease subunit